MASLTLNWSTLDRRKLLRSAAGGVVWGLTVAAGLLGLNFYLCGTICTGEIVETTALSVAAGIVTLCPLALIRSEDAAFAQ